MTPQEVIEMHHKAMDIAMAALLTEPDKDTKIKMNKRAFELEKEAAMSIVDRRDLEPTRSILFRSAGWLALNADQPEMALEMAIEGTKYTIHEDIKAELLELKEAAQNKLNNEHK